MTRADIYSCETVSCGDHRDAVRSEESDDCEDNVSQNKMCENSRIADFIDAPQYVLSSPHHSTQVPKSPTCGDGVEQRLVASIVRR